MKDDDSSPLYTKAFSDIQTGLISYAQTNGIGWSTFPRRDYHDQTYIRTNYLIEDIDCQTLVDESIDFWNRMHHEIDEWCTKQWGHRLHIKEMDSQPPFGPRVCCVRDPSARANWGIEVLFCHRSFVAQSGDIHFYDAGIDPTFRKKMFITPLSLDMYDGNDEYDYLMSNICNSHNWN